MLSTDNMDQILFWDGMANSFWMTPLLILLFFLASSCNKTIEKAQDFNKICRKIDSTTVGELDVNLKEIVSESMHQN